MTNLNDCNHNTRSWFTLPKSTPSRPLAFCLSHYSCEKHTELWRLVSRLVIKETIKITKVKLSLQKHIWAGKTTSELPRWKVLTAINFKFVELNLDGLLLIYKPVLFKSVDGIKHKYILSKLKLPWPYLIILQYKQSFYKMKQNTQLTYKSATQLLTSQWQWTGRKLLRVSATIIHSKTLLNRKSSKGFSPLQSSPCFKVKHCILKSNCTEVFPRKVLLKHV